MPRTTSPEPGAADNDHEAEATPSSPSVLSCTSPLHHAVATPSKRSLGTHSGSGATSDSTRDVLPSDRSFASGGTVSEQPSRPQDAHADHHACGGHAESIRGDCLLQDAPRSPKQTTLRGGATGQSPPWKTRLEELLLQVPDENDKDKHRVPRLEMKDVEVQAGSSEAHGKLSQDAEVQAAVTAVLPEEQPYRPPPTAAPTAAKDEVGTCDLEEVRAASEASRGRPRSRPPPVIKRPPSRAASAGAPSALPDWKGPLPPAEWRPERIINWQPVRQASRFDGSVWQRVHDTLALAPAGLPEETLQTSFMRKGNGGTMRRTRSASQLPTSRCLSQAQALAADLAHAQLQRLGISNVAQLHWVVGKKQQGGCGNEELSQEVLETLLNLLRAGAAEEQTLLEASAQSGPMAAPSEAFLQELYQAGPPPQLRLHTETALKMVRFKDRSRAMLADIAMGALAARGVLQSRAVPILLQGVLLLGNYVNGHSKALGNAVCITLDSLPKLAHTRCLVQGADNRGPVTGAETALQLLVRELASSRPSFLEQLTLDLEACKPARHLDRQALGNTLQELLEDVKTVDMLLGAAAEGVDLPSALERGRLDAFLQFARPTLATVEEQLRELDATTETLRVWFAEPHGVPLCSMMQSLASLHEGLPAVSVPRQALSLPQLGSVSVRRPSVAARHSGSTGVRSQSAPPQHRAKGDALLRVSTEDAAQRRASSAPPPGTGKVNERSPSAWQPNRARRKSLPPKCGSAQSLERKCSYETLPSTPKRRAPSGKPPPSPSHAFSVRQELPAGQPSVPRTPRKSPSSSASAVP